MSNGSRPTAKRSPSILVTDARTTHTKGARAPFAGQNYKKQQQQQQQQQQQNHQNPHQNHQQNHQLPGGPGVSRGPMGINLHKRFTARANKYTDISVDKLLSNSSDIPSGQSRLPLLNQSGPFSPPQRSMSPPGVAPTMDLRRRNIRSIPKLTQNLPARTSKNSQRLVLIPDDLGMPHSPHRIDSPPPLGDRTTPLIYRSRAELMPKEARAKEFSRVTAYYICEEFNLEALLDFLSKNHEVKPRLYDEALYVPYALPLLPGNDGFRVKSNDTAKSLPNKRYMEKMINKSEQTDRLYEYFSGVETPEDANNYSMDPEEGAGDNNGPFDPSEPQFFAPPLDESDSDSGSNNSNSTVGSPQQDHPSSNTAELDPRNHKHKDHKQTSDDLTELSKHAEMFVLEYGIVVFWNLSEIHEKNILADLAFASETPEPLLIHPISEQDIETEEFHFEYDSQIQRPRIFNDMITLRSGDHLIKLAMSHAIAQLTKLCLFESRMVYSLQLISKLPKKLALTGRLGLKRQQLMKKSGKLFKLRVDVNLSSSILDTPEYFWSVEPALHPLYSAVREYLEIEQRVQVLNERCKVFLEFTNIISDSINESSTTRITMMIMIIILISLFVSVFEFVLEIL
ncbi:CIC11C00000005465 [Sungouiella intermedia]|uniref:CIC11C00000005465 n=1 Tax=Sungouiella intermedia TaxID=45354 RepID=A0A1L0DT55_9ASCO|nr:CIC11C00000005465 [[Candida] intermedia]